MTFHSNPHSKLQEKSFRTCFVQLLKLNHWALLKHTKTFWSSVSYLRYDTPTPPLPFYDALRAAQFPQPKCQNLMYFPMAHIWSPKTTHWIYIIIGWGSSFRLKLHTKIPFQLPVTAPHISSSKAKFAKLLVPTKTVISSSESPLHICITDTMNS